MATNNLAVINGTCPIGNPLDLPGYHEDDEAVYEKWVREQQGDNLKRIGMLLEEAGIGYLYEDEQTQLAKLDEVRALAREIAHLCDDWYELDRLLNS